MGDGRLMSIVGEKFGKLTIVSPTSERGSDKSIVWKCKCECGNITFVPTNRLRVGTTKSCGCLVQERIKKQTKHGKTYTPTWNAWIGIKERCYNKNNNRYEIYGGRGIKVRKRWRNSFENFFEDMEERPSSKHSIDRKDNNGDYTPDNCRWATRSQQMKNRRKYKHKKNRRTRIKLQ